MPFVCNVCGTPLAAAAEPLTREGQSCAKCGSSVRLRALIALLSEEIFGVLLALPEFSVLKGIRGIGMSDKPGAALRLHRSGRARCWPLRFYSVQRGYGARSAPGGTRLRDPPFDAEAGWS